MSAEPSAADRWSSWLTHGRFMGRSVSQRGAAEELLRRFRDTVLDHADLQPGERVLDVGAGTGLLATRAAELVGPSGTVIALDVSVPALEKIPAGPRVRRVGGDVVSLPLAGGRVDAVVMRSVLIYVADSAAAMREIARVLRPGGRVSLFEPVNSQRGHNVDLSSLPASFHAALKGGSVKPDRATDPMLAFDPERFLPVVAEAGLRPETVASELVVEQLTTAEEVDGYLRRPPNPCARAPLEEITDQLGADAAERCRAVWLDALRSGPVEFSTPVLYLSARKPS